MGHCRRREETDCSVEATCSRKASTGERSVYELHFAAFLRVIDAVNREADKPTTLAKIWFARLTLFGESHST